MSYGYWTFGNKNGLVGGPSTVETIPDGRQIVVKDPDLPAVLEDEFIIFALRQSRIARDDFTRLFPSLDAVSQARLTAITGGLDLIRVPLVVDAGDLKDAIQKKQVTSGVHLEKPPKP